MEGIILIVTYAVVSALGEMVAVGLGFGADKINPGISLLVFFIGSAAVLALAWPIALWLTKPKAVAPTIS